MTKRFQKEMSNRAKEVKIEFVGFSNISQFIAKKKPNKIHISTSYSISGWYASVD